MEPESSFKSCPNLTEVIIPNSVTVFEKHAFWDYETVTLRVPVGTKEAYMACTGWKNFKHIEEFSSQETGIRSITIDNK